MSEDVAAGRLDVSGFLNLCMLGCGLAGGGAGFKNQKNQTIVWICLSFIGWLVFEDARIKRAAHSTLNITQKQQGE